MKIVYAIVLSIFFCTPLAQSQVSGVYDKEFFQSELSRYKAYSLRSASGVTADDRIDVTYYKLDLRVTTSPHYLRGNVVVKAASLVNGLSVITLDLMNPLTVDSVKSG